MKGKILKAISGFYYVTCESELYQCKARGNFRKSGISPLVGDNAIFELSKDSDGIITGLDDRKNNLWRPPIANIDKLVIISSFEKPTPNTYLIDKMTSIAVYNNIEPLIVFNKCDTGDQTEWKRIYTHAGFKSFVVSALSGEGVDSLITELKSSISVFTGNSGVGKSSLINYIFKDLNLETGEISEKLGRGRHTTRHTELYESPYGGYIADTPGFSSIEHDISDFNYKLNLVDTFPDFKEYISQCRFSSCTHTNEPGCSLKNAVSNGNIEETRYKSFLELTDEMKNLKAWNTKNYKKM